MFFIVCFVAWYDSAVAGWLLAESNRHTLSLLVLGSAALLLWWHLIGTGPRLHVALSPWLGAIALLIVELASMSIAVPTTFATEPLYPHYVAAFGAGEERALRLVDDQALGGGLIWVAGSAVYLSSIVLVLNRLFHRHKMDGSEPLPGWDADERMIMPGLEHRVGPKVAAATAPEESVAAGMRLRSGGDVLVGLRPLSGRGTALRGLAARRRGGSALALRRRRRRGPARKGPRPARSAVHSHRCGVV